MISPYHLISPEDNGAVDVSSAWARIHLHPADSYSEGPGALALIQQYGGA